MKANSNSKVMIGYPNCIGGTARLDVTDDQIGTGVKGLSSTTGLTNIGVYGIGIQDKNSQGASRTFGVSGESGPIHDDVYAAGVAGFVEALL